jgi:ABC-type protease/lipase transport system fused ATPase/permease subunit
MNSAIKAFWESLNSGTNILAVSLIAMGAYLAMHGDKVTGGSIVTGGFTLLNNSKKVEGPASPLAPKQ